MHFFHVFLPSPYLICFSRLREVWAFDLFLFLYNSPFLEDSLFAKIRVFPSCTFFPLCWVLYFIHNWQLLSFFNYQVNEITFQCVG